MLYQLYLGTISVVGEECSEFTPFIQYPIFYPVNQYFYRFLYLLLLYALGKLSLEQLI